MHSGGRLITTTKVQIFRLSVTFIGFHNFSSVSIPHFSGSSGVTRDVSGLSGYWYLFRKVQHSY